MTTDSTEANGRSPTSAISELVLEVADLEASRAFYRDVLGLTETLHGEGREGRYWYLIGETASRAEPSPRWGRSVRDAALSDPSDGRAGVGAKAGLAAGAGEDVVEHAVEVGHLAELGVDLRGDLLPGGALERHVHRDESDGDVGGGGLAVLPG